MSWSFFTANSKFFPASTYFDHLYSEYEAIKPLVTDPEDHNLADRLRDRRYNRSLAREERFAWDHVYSFELMLIKYLPPDNLRIKVIALRDQYLNIFGQDKYRTYLETKPVDPATITDTSSSSDIEKARADARFLSNQTNLSLAALTSREGLGKRLTIWAAYLLIAVPILLIVGLFILKNWLKLSGTPLKVAFLAGAIGGLLSILHRLQSVPSGGDPIFSLATFWHGSYALFVSPLTGAIFAILLYLMFAGGILEGRFFPDISTPVGAATGPAGATCGEMTPPKARTLAMPTPTPESSPSNPDEADAPDDAGGTSQPGDTSTSGGDTAPPGNNASAGDNTSAGNTSTTGNTSTNGNTASAPVTTATATPVTTNSPGSSNRQGGLALAAERTTPANTNTSTDSAPSSPALTGSSGFTRFMNCSGPASGIDYALLVIWCFLAGFAERLVPDTLNRLVDESDNPKIKKT